MIIYKYDPCGVFVEAVNARVDPEDSSRALIPRDATTKQPPAVGPGEVPVFDEKTKEWGVTVDNRGKRWDCIEKKDIFWSEPGDLPPTVALTAPPSLNHEWDATAKTWSLPAETKRQIAFKTKLIAIRKETLKRVPKRFDKYENLVVMFSYLGDVIDYSASPDHVAAKVIYDYAESKINELSVAATAVIESYDPGTDANFPS